MGQTGRFSKLPIELRQKMSIMTLNGRTHPGKPIVGHDVGSDFKSLLTISTPIDTAGQTLDTGFYCWGNLPTGISRRNRDCIHQLVSNENEQQGRRSFGWGRCWDIYFYGHPFAGTRFGKPRHSACGELGYPVLFAATDEKRFGNLQSHGSFVRKCKPVWRMFNRTGSPGIVFVDGIYACINFGIRRSATSRIDRGSLQFDRG